MLSPKKYVKRGHVKFHQVLDIYFRKSAIMQQYPVLLSPELATGYWKITIIAYNHKNAISIGVSHVLVSGVFLESVKQVELI